MTCSNLVLNFVLVNLMIFCVSTLKKSATFLFLLVNSCYAHFYVEHDRGKRASTRVF